MKASTQTVVLLLTTALYTLSPAIAQGSDGDAYRKPARASSSVYAATLATVDRHLLEAIQAVDESARKTALRAAQVALDTIGLNSDTVPSTKGAPGESAGWLAQTERSLGRFQEQTRKELRESLMHKLWESPYGTIPVDDLAALETISDALRLLREIQRLGGGDTEALARLQGIYWNGLMSHRQVTGLEYTVLGDMETTPVFDQRVLRDKNGKIQLYQLTGTDNRTLRWVQVSSRDIPSGLLASEALIVDLSRESAPWLLVMDGEGVADRVLAHRRWLDAIERQVRLVLIERGDYLPALRDMPPEWFGSNRRIPYVLAARPNQTPGYLHLIRVAEKRILGSWPLSNLDGPGGPALKALINRILAAENPQ